MEGPDNQLSTVSQPTIAPLLNQHDVSPSPNMSPEFCSQLMMLLKNGLVQHSDSTSANFAHTWILDSDASDHMCFSRDLFSDFKPLNTQFTISLPNGHHIRVTHLGNITLSPDINLCVIYVPFFKLLSISKLTQPLGGIITFTHDCCCKALL